MNRLQRIMSAYNTYKHIADGHPVVANFNPSEIKLKGVVKDLLVYGMAVNPENKYELRVTAVRKYKKKVSHDK